MVFEQNVAAIGSLVLKVNSNLVVAVVVFVECCEHDFSVTKMVVLTEVNVADIDVQVMVSSWEGPFAAGILAPTGVFATVLIDGGEPLLTIGSELHVNSGVHLITNVTGVDVKVGANDVDSYSWHSKIFIIINS